METEHPLFDLAGAEASAESPQTQKSCQSTPSIRVPRLRYLVQRVPLAKWNALQLRTREHNMYI